MKAWRWRLREAECTGCGICADVCSPGAIVMTREMALPEPTPGLCAGCLICVRECPFDALVVEPVEASEGAVAG